MWLDNLGENIKHNEKRNSVGTFIISKVEAWTQISQRIIVALIFSDGKLTRGFGDTSETSSLNTNSPTFFSEALRLHFVNPTLWVLWSIGVTVYKSLDKVESVIKGLQIWTLG